MDYNKISSIGIALAKPILIEPGITRPSDCIVGAYSEDRAKK